MENYIEVTLHTNHPGETEIMVALLADAGAIGFEEGKGVLKAIFGEKGFDGDSIKKIISLKNIVYSISNVESKNWNAIWEAGFQPVLIGDFCCIRAPFHPVPGKVRHDILITPKMSFGTGHHPTTFLVVEAMSRLEIGNAAVFDFGTGTGVLAILAEKCGAATVTAMDNDEWSIRNATENFIANDCGKVMLINAEKIPEHELFDVILANINRHVILLAMDSFKQHLLPGGIVLMSGLLTGDQEIVVQSAGAAGLVPVAVTEREGWICLQLGHA